MLRWFLLLAVLVTTARGLSVNTTVDGSTGVSNTPSQVINMEDPHNANETHAKRKQENSLRAIGYMGITVAVVVILFVVFVALFIQLLHACNCITNRKEVVDKP